MPKERIVRATFSDGTVLERGSVSRVYTHAYLARGKYPERTGEYARPGGEWDTSGFSASAAQAQKNMEAETAWGRRAGYTRDFAEVVAIEVVEKRSAA
jgi:hypothetical protein